MGFNKFDYAIKIETENERKYFHERGDSNLTEKLKLTNFCKSGTANKEELEQLLKKTGNHK